MFEDYLLTSFLLAATVAASVEYYRRLRKARKEYEKARSAMNDLILSFNRQFTREEEKIENTALRVQTLSSRADGAINETLELGKKLQTLQARIDSASESKEKMALMETKLEEIDKRSRDATTSYEALAAKISLLEEQTQQFSVFPETKIEAVIPIKRERALAPLTETELSVLEMLASEGSKTAPETKEKIKLSREHTARLMKKLYEGGYLERETGKIPFKYQVKKEMESLLKKKENATGTA